MITSTPTTETRWQAEQRVERELAAERRRRIVERLSRLRPPRTHSLIVLSVPGPGRLRP
jgi:hypothetical protein